MSKDPGVPWWPAARSARPWLAAVAAVALLLATVAGPTLARDHQATSGGGQVVGHDRPMHFADVRVSPRLGGPTTTIRFTVAIRWGGPRGTGKVRVLVDGRPHRMTVVPGGRQGGSVAYAYTSRLNLGNHRIAFAASARGGAAIRVEAGSVRIVSSPRSAGAAPAGPAHDGSGASAVKPVAGAEGTGTSPEASVSTDSAAPPPACPGAVAESVGQTVGALDGRDDTWPTPTSTTDAPGPAAEPGAGTVAASSPPTGAVDGAAGVPGPNVGSGGGARAGLGPFFSADPLVQLGLDGGVFGRTFRAVPVLITSTGTVVLWAAFLTFGRRRRDGDPPAPEPVLASRAASGLQAPAASLVPPPWVDPSEAGLPRWRRPSLLEARKADPVRRPSTTVAASLTFADGAVGPVAGKARRRIRYRLVPLLDLPDETRASEIGLLDQGDEVQPLEKSGAHWLVLCPDGRRGWLHQMVLGEVIEDDAESAAPVVAAGIDEDVLVAFLNQGREPA